MMLVGISGAIGHGKTSFANFLTSCSPGAAHFESSDIIMEVANGLRAGRATPSADNIPAVIEWLRLLPEVLSERAHVEIDFDQLNLSAEHFAASPQDFATLTGYLRLMELQPELTSVQIHTANKSDFRPLLQWLGGYVAKAISGRLWFDEIVRRGTATAADLITAGGVRFPEDAACLREAGGIIVTIIRPTTDVVAADDLTERERSQITPDVTVMNDSTLADLQTVARLLYADLLADRIQSTYVASTVT